jgi:hypothetical protein
MLPHNHEQNQLLESASCRPSMYAKHELGRAGRNVIELFRRLRLTAKSKPLTI